MKILIIITRLIFILCLPALLISCSIAAGFNSQWLYEYGFNKYNVSESTGISEANLHLIAAEMIRYFNSSDEYVQIDIVSNSGSFKLFTQEEQLHFKDVKGLVSLDYLILWITLAYLICYSLICLFGRRSQRLKMLMVNIFWGSALCIVLLAIIGVAALINFDWLFLHFHYLVFTNQYWSAEGYMLLLFPGGFWSDAALFCIVLILFMAFVLGILSLLYLKSNELGFFSKKAF